MTHILMKEQLMATKFSPDQLSEIIAVTLALAVLAPLSGAFVAACGLLVLLVPLHHLAGAVR